MHFYAIHCNAFSMRSMNRIRREVLSRKKNVELIHSDVSGFTRRTRVKNLHPYPVPTHIIPLLNTEKVLNFSFIIRLFFVCNLQFLKLLDVNE